MGALVVTSDSTAGEGTIGVVTAGYLLNVTGFSLAVVTWDWRVLEFAPSIGATWVGLAMGMTMGEVTP